MQWIFKLISAPFFNMLLKGWQMKLEAATQSGAQAADVAKAAMIAEVQARASKNELVAAQFGKWYIALPMVVVMGSGALFFAKCVVWDKVLGWGSTEPLAGDIQTTYNLIMSFWFGGAAVKGAIVAARTWWR